MIDLETPQAPPPSMLSAEFHLRFFPALLKSRFGSKTADRTSFVSAIFMHGVVVLTAAIAAASLGTSLYPGIAGWLLLALATIGVVYVLVISIREALGIPPTYECFLFPLFFFCMSLGLVASALAALGQPPIVKVAYGCVGLAVGYWVGLLAGLHGQRIGFIAVLLYPFAIAGAAGGLVTAMVLFS